MLASPAFSLPENADVVQGDVSITLNASEMQVHQNSNRAVVNYDSFNIDAGESVIFNQPSSDSVILNRVTGGERSDIFGSMQSNGQVFLVNPNGVFFSENSHLDMGSILISTLDIKDDDFLNKHYQFFGESNAPIQNLGNLFAGKNGYITLIANDIINSGSLFADEGHIGLSGGQSVIVSFDDDTVGFAITEMSKLSSIDNTGTLSAGESVVLESHSNVSAEDMVINNSGIIRAGGLELVNGEIRITASNGAVVNHGEIATSSNTGDSRDSGTVQLRAERIAHYGEISSNAYDEGDGGNITVYATDALLLAEGSLMEANADAIGNGGTIINYSENATLFEEGSVLSAVAGSHSGNGGFIEVSGANHVAVFGSVDTTAQHGENGLFYIDPTNISIVAGAAETNGNFNGGGPWNWLPSGGGSSSIGVDVINTLLVGGNNVTIDTASFNTGGDTGELRVDTDINIDGASGQTLTLRANTLLDINGNICDIALGACQSTPDSTINLVLDTDTHGNSGVINIGGGVSLDTGGGSLDILGDDDIVVAAGTELATRGGAITITSPESFDASAGIQFDSGGGNISINAFQGTDLGNSVLSNINDLDITSFSGDVILPDVGLSVGRELTLRSESTRTASGSSSYSINAQDLNLDLRTRNGTETITTNVDNLEIVYNAGSTASDLTINEVDALNVGRVAQGGPVDLFLNANGDITFSDTVDLSFSDGGQPENSFTATSFAGSIFLNATMADLIFFVPGVPGNISLNAANNIETSPGIALRSNGGDISFNAGGDIVLGNGINFTTENGNINFSAADTLNIDTSATFDTDVGSVQINGVNGLDLADSVFDDVIDLTLTSISGNIVIPAAGLTMNTLTISGAHLIDSDGNAMSIDARQFDLNLTNPADRVLVTPVSGGFIDNLSVALGNSELFGLTLFAASDPSRDTVNVTNIDIPGGSFGIFANSFSETDINITNVTNLDSLILSSTNSGMGDILIPDAGLNVTSFVDLSGNAIGTSSGSRNYTINTSSLTLSTNAQGGAEIANTNVDSLALTVDAVSETNTLSIVEADNLNVGVIFHDGPTNLSFSAVGDITFNGLAELNHTDVGQTENTFSVTSTGGSIIFNTDLVDTTPAQPQTTRISLDAANNVELAAGVDILSNGNDISVVAGDQLVLGNASTIDSGAGQISVNANSVALDGSLISASGSAQAIDIDSATTINGSGVNNLVAQSGGLDLMANTGINVQTDTAFITAANPTSGDIVIVEADDIDLLNINAINNLDVTSTSGDVTATVISAGNDIALSAPSGAVLIPDAGLTTSGDVTLIGNAISTLLGSSDYAINASTLTLNTNAQAGSESVTTNIDNLNLTFNAAADTNTLSVTEANDLIVDSLRQNGPNNLSITSGGDVTFNTLAELSHTNFGQTENTFSVISTGGAIIFNTDLVDTTPAQPQTSRISLDAANNVELAAGVDILSNGNDISVIAGDQLVLGNASTMDSGAGQISVNANSVVLGGSLMTSSNSAQAIDIDSATMINGSGVNNLVAQSGGVDLMASSGINVQTDTMSITAANAVSGDIVLVEEDDINLANVNAINNLDVTSNSGDVTATAISAGNDVALSAPSGTVFIPDAGLTTSGDVTLIGNAISTLLGSSDYAINASTLTLNTNAQAGSETVATNVDNLNLTFNAAADTNSLSITEANDLIVNSVSQSGPNNLSITSGGDVTFNTFAELSHTDFGQTENTFSVISTGGAIIFNTDLVDTTPAQLQTTRISLDAANNVELAASVDISSNGNDISVIAGDQLVLGNASTIDSGAGQINVNANNVALDGSLISASGSAQAIDIDSATTINGSGVNNLVAQSGGVDLMASSGINVQTDTMSITAANAVSGDIVLVEEDDINLASVNAINNLDVTSNSGDVTATAISAGNDVALSAPSGTVLIPDAGLSTGGDVRLTGIAIGTLLGSSDYVINANTLTLSTYAQAGSETVTTNVDNLNLTFNAAVDTNTLSINETNDLIVNSVSQNGPNNLSITSGGDVTFNTLAELSHTDFGQTENTFSVISTGGAIIFNTDLVDGTPAQLQTTRISLDAANNVELAASVDISSNGNDISVIAGDQLVLGNASTIDSGAGQINVNANNVALDGSLISASGSAQAIDIDSATTINGSGVNNLVAQSGGVDLMANSGINVQTDTMSITVANAVSGDIVLVEEDDINLANVNAVNNLDVTSTSGDLTIANLSFGNDLFLSATLGTITVPDSGLTTAGAISIDADNFVDTMGDAITVNTDRLILGVSNPTQDMNINGLISNLDVTLGQTADFILNSSLSPEGEVSTIVIEDINLVNGSFNIDIGSGRQTNIQLDGLTDFNNLNLVNRSTQGNINLPATGLTANGTVTLLAASLGTAGGSREYTINVPSLDLTTAAQGGAETLNGDVDTLSLTFRPANLSDSLTLNDTDDITFDALILDGSNAFNLNAGGNITFNNLADLSGVDQGQDQNTLSITSNNGSVIFNTNLVDSSTAPAVSTQIAINAAADIELSTGQTVQSNGGNISLNAGNQLHIDNLASVQSGAGQINALGNSVLLNGSLISDSSSNQAINVTSDSSIIGNRVNDIVAPTGGIILNGASGIDIGTEVATAAVANSTSGDIVVQELDDLTLLSVETPENISIESMNGALNIPETGLSSAGTLTLLANHVFSGGSNTLNFSANELILAASSPINDITVTGEISNADIQIGGTSNLFLQSSDNLNVRDLDGDGQALSTNNGNISIHMNGADLSLDNTILAQDNISDGVKSGLIDIEVLAGNVSLGTNNGLSLISSSSFEGSDSEGLVNQYSNNASIQLVNLDTTNQPTNVMVGNDVGNNVLLSATGGDIVIDAFGQNTDPSVYNILFGNNVTLAASDGAGESNTGLLTAFGVDVSQTDIQIADGREVYLIADRAPRPILNNIDAIITDSYAPDEIDSIPPLGNTTTQTQSSQSLEGILGVEGIQCEGELKRKPRRECNIAQAQLRFLGTFLIYNELPSINLGLEK